MMVLFYHDTAVAVKKNLGVFSEKVWGVFPGASPLLFPETGREKSPQKPAVREDLFAYLFSFPFIP